LIENKMGVRRSENDQYFLANFRELKGRLMSSLTYYFGIERLSIIEDIIQDTFYTALKSWPTNPPESREAWLMVVAKNKARNYIKRNRKLLLVEDIDHNLLGQIDNIFTESEIEISQLNILFSCSRLDLPERSRVMVILKLLCGFDAGQIAKVLILNREAVFKNLQRSIKSLNKEKLRFYLDDPSKKNLKTVHTVLYLMFHEGFQTYPENAERGKDFCCQAVYLSNLLIDKGLCDPHTYALLSLMYFNLARFESRKSESGDFILLENQDRERWDKRMIALGFKYLEISESGTDLSQYHLEAAIASIHCTSDSFANTNWKKILWYYNKLLDINPSSIVLLNKAIVVYYLYGAEKAQPILEDLENDKKISSYSLFYIVRGEITLKLGDRDGSFYFYKKALVVTKSNMEKAFIKRKIKDIDKIGYALR